MALLSHKLIIIMVIVMRMKHIEAGLGPSASCPGTGPWQHLESTGSCFLVIAGGKDFGAAETGCRALGGELASITSFEEQAFVLSLVNQLEFVDDHYYIGLNDKVIEGDWVWTDGSDYSAYNQGWCSGEPNGDDCVGVKPSCNGWNDVPCSWTLQAICKAAEIGSDGTKFSPCFPLSSVVLDVTRGAVSLGGVAPGDVVMTLDGPGGNQVSSAVLAVLHHSAAAPTRFLRLTTGSGRRVEVSGAHGVYGYPGGGGRYMLAEELRQGDYLLAAEGDREEIRAIEYVHKTGYIAVLTEHGSILADGVYASCYASVREHYLADLAMAPIKMLYKIAMKLGFPLRSGEEMWYTKVLATLYT